MAETDFWQRMQQWLHDANDCYLYTCPLELVLSMAPPLRPELRVLIADAENLDEVMTTLPDLSPVIVNYVRQGHLAFLAAGATMWVFRSVAILGPRTYNVHGYPLALTHEDVYLECAETHPDWRGKGIAPGMLGPTARELLTRGYHHIYVTISLDNLASRKALEKGGATPQGIITSQRRFGHWRACFARDTTESHTSTL